LEAETIGYWLGLIGIGAILSSIISTWYSYSLEQKKFKREQGIAYLREKLDKFYSPMIFHFENMKSWGAFWGEQSYVYATETVASKISDMNELMRLGLRFVSREVEALWYEWQPYAVAAVEERRGKSPYPQFRSEEFQKWSERLHRALSADRDNLMNQHRLLIGRE